jgi:SAM-dependent methyltransferase
MKSSLVRDGYDRIARIYLENRGRLKSGKYIQQLLKYLPKQASILDLGCGAGVPVDDVLLKAGHSVIGIDISPEQIRLARKNCPRGEFLVGDISALKEREYSVDAVIAFYAIFHVPRETQGRLLKTIATYLPKKGLLLITMGDREFEGEHELHGVKMWSSQFSTAKNRALVEAAGFSVITDEIDNSGGERHQIVLAEKL